ncbi:MAG TPA: ribonuclease P protein component [Phycisphaerales bacterium]|nr:ribonuclease P protein component [Phycisphaerales bacterium]HCD31457.1 ribonuclease P protein component [Phycisphaerales bacterium]|tara:strand:- start:95 stop:487 length:393 start_codon:yes stop_codon:yes gene_type:complete
MKRYRFTSAQRLHGKTDFSAVYKQGKRWYGGPLVVVAVPNDLTFNRLGLSVSRKVGNAVKRHRIKRLLRESFRLSQCEHPIGYDIIIIVRPHDLLAQVEYQTILLKSLSKLHAKWGQVNLDSVTESCPEG